MQSFEKSQNKLISVASKVKKMMLFIMFCGQLAEVDPFLCMELIKYFPYFLVIDSVLETLDFWGKK